MAIPVTGELIQARHCVFHSLRDIELPGSPSVSRDGSCIKSARRLVVAVSHGRASRSGGSDVRWGEAARMFHFIHSCIWPCLLSDKRSLVTRGRIASHRRALMQILSRKLPCASCAPIVCRAPLSLANRLRTRAILQRCLSLKPQPLARGPAEGFDAGDQLLCADRAAAFTSSARFRRCLSQQIVCLVNEWMRSVPF
jgi:hypothetical protein